MQGEKFRKLNARNRAADFARFKMTPHFAVFRAGKQFGDLEEGYTRTVASIYILHPSECYVDKDISFFS